MSSVMTTAGAGIFDWGAPSIYDVTTFDKYDLINAANSTIEGFFNNPRVREALNVPKNAGSWSGCIPGAGRRRRRNLLELASKGDFHRRLHLLDYDEPVSMAPYMAELLDDAEIPVLIYSGDRDLSTCAQGSELVLNGMEWSGSDDWLNPHKYRRGLWMVDNYPAGYSKTVKKLNFVVVYNSGHLVPMNVPVAALDLISRFLKDESFVDEKIEVVYDAVKVSNQTSVTSKAGWWLLVCVAFVVGIVASTLISKFTGRKREQYDPIIET